MRESLSDCRSPLPTARPSSACPLPVCQPASLDSVASGADPVDLPVDPLPFQVDAVTTLLEDLLIIASCQRECEDWTKRRSKRLRRRAPPLSIKLCVHIALCAYCARARMVSRKRYLSTMLGLDHAPQAGTCSSCRSVKLAHKLIQPVGGCRLTGQPTLII